MTEVFRRRGENVETRLGNFVEESFGNDDLNQTAVVGEAGEKKMLRRSS